MNDAFSLATRLQAYRQVKAFEIWVPTQRRGIGITSQRGSSPMLSPSVSSGNFAMESWPVLVDIQRIADGSSCRSVISRFVASQLADGCARHF